MGRWSSTSRMRCFTPVSRATGRPGERGPGPAANPWTPQRLARARPRASAATCRRWSCRLSIPWIAPGGGGAGMHAELAQLQVEAAPGDAEAPRGRVDVALLLAQRLLDGLALDLLERDGRGRGRRGRRPRGAGASETEVLGLDPAPFARDERPLEHVPELADVAGPGVLDEGVERARGELGSGPLPLARGALEEAAHERRDVVAALAEGRDLEDG